MVAAFAMNQATPEPEFASGDWQPAAYVQEYQSEDLQCRVWVRRAAESDPASWTLWTNTGYGDEVAAAVAVWRDADDPDVAATTIHPGRGGPFTLPTLGEGPGVGGLVLHVVGACRGSWSGDPWQWDAPPSGWTARVQTVHLSSNSVVGLTIVEGTSQTGPDLTISGVGASGVAARSATLTVPAAEVPSGPVVYGWGPAPVAL